jgi:hypothetical protein
MPGTVTLGIRFRRNMAEEIHVDRLAGQTPQAGEGLDAGPPESENGTLWNVGSAGSLRLDVREFDHLAPFLGFFSD